MREESHKCWHFVMSSFARSYGVPRAMCEQKFHEIALQWCDDNNYQCNVYLDDLNKVDTYFKNIYENWEG